MAEQALAREPDLGRLKGRQFNRPRFGGREANAIVGSRRAFLATEVVGRWPMMAQLILCLLIPMAVAHVTDPNIGAGGIAYVIESLSSNAAGKAILAVVAVAIISAAVAGQAISVRLVFSMARHGKLIGSRPLARVGPRTQTPPARSSLCSASPHSCSASTSARASYYGPAWDQQYSAIIVVCAVVLLGLLHKAILRTADEGNPVREHRPGAVQPAEQGSELVSCA